MTAPSAASSAALDVTVTEEELKNAQDSATKAWNIIQADRTSGGLLEVQQYLAGQMAGPYTPTDANAEYKFLAERSFANWLIVALNAPAQALFLEDHLVGVDPNSTSTSQNSSDSSPGFKAAWKRNRLQSRQSDLYRDALAYEMAFVAVMPDERDYVVAAAGQTKRARPMLCSRLNSVGLYVDPVNDERPAFFLYVQKDPVDQNNPGYGLAWDLTNVYDVQVTLDSKAPVTLNNARPHGHQMCPVTAFVPYRDLTGKPRGLVKPLIPIQDRINQSIFDLLVTQSFGAFKVKWVSGMVPPTQKTTVSLTKAEAIAQGLVDPNDPYIQSLADSDNAGHQTIDVVDTDGNPVLQNITISPSRFFVLEDPAAKAGVLDETPLGGYIESIAMSVHHLAAIAQVPPQLLTGNIANLSAEAIAALSQGLDRMVVEFQHSFGAGWDQVFGDIAVIEGSAQAGDEAFGESVWRDMTSRSLAQTVDALGKLSSNLQIPAQGLWTRVPGATASEVDTWKQLADQQSQNLQSGPANALARTISPANRGFVASAQPSTPPTPDPSAPPVSGGVSG